MMKKSTSSQQRMLTCSKSSKRNLYRYLSKTKAKNPRHNPHWVSRYKFAKRLVNTGNQR